MVQINFAQRTVNAKIVYYGPGMSGKTTNLEVIHQRAPSNNRGELTSISTDGDRTLFFDFMPLDLGTVAGMRTCFQIYTVPGQVYYNSTRKLVLQGVDGVVFVADSSASMQEENLESMKNLEENLAEYGRNLDDLPLVIQYNKRDLPDAMTVEELEQLLNPRGAPSFEGVANTGQGVFPTLKALAACVIDHIHRQQRSGSGGGQSSQAPAPGLAQTGFHAPPAATLSQTGFHAAVNPESQPAAPAPAPAPAPAQAAPAPSLSIQKTAAARPQPQVSRTQPQQPQPQAQQPAQQQQAAAKAGDGLRLSRPSPRGNESGQAAPVRRPQQPQQPQGLSMKPAAAAAQPAMAPQPARAQAAAVAPPPQQQRPQQHMMQPDAAAPPPAQPRSRSFPSSGQAQKHPAVRPTPQAAGKKSVVVTGLIVAASVGLGAVIGSVVLSIL